MDEQRALLDQLMGSQRDVPDELKREVHFYDREIDKFWLLGVQPFDLFKNTIWAPKLPVFHRMALGYEWEKREQPLSVLAEWDALDAGARAAYGYERDLYRFLEVLVEACDKAVKRARDAHYARATEVTGADAKRAVDMDRRIAELEREAEACGEAGDVDGSLARMAEIDAVNAQKAELVKPPDAALKKVLVCEVSSNVVQNTEVRIQEHYSGRLYHSWKKVRDRLLEYRLKYERKADDARPPAAEDERPPRPAGRDDAPRPPRPPRRHRSRSRDRSRRERRSRSRDRSRRDGRRSRDRSRDGRRDDRRRDDRRDDRREVYRYGR